jgi:RNA polymerase sigma-70 factor (ECF subfamily)
MNAINWVDEHGDFLFYYAWSRVHDRALAEDLVQETFLAALQSKDAYARKSSERTWLVGILKHKLVDYYRQARKYNQLVYDDNAGANRLLQTIERQVSTTNFEETDWRLDPVRSYEQRVFIEILNSCLAQMPPRLAASFKLREIEQLDTREICTILDVSESNFWVMLHRARQLLRRRLELKWLRHCDAQKLERRMTSHA